MCGWAFGRAAAFTAQVEASYARAGHSAWPFVASCHGWSPRATDRYLGPWDNPTPAPVLVVGNTYDPATPLASSVRMAQELADGLAFVLTHPDPAALRRQARQPR